MKIPKINWVNKRQRVGPPVTYGYVGRLRIFTVTYSLTVRGGYTLRHSLPDMGDGWAAESESQARVRAETLLKTFIKRLYWVSE